MNKWTQQHIAKWNAFLKSQGLSDEEAAKYSTWLGVQDSFETGYGSNRGARELHNYGGMMTKKGYIKYDTDEDYMADKWKMMNKKFPDALKADSMDEYARILGDPSRVGKNYLYYVVDGVPLDQRNPSEAWKRAQTEHMNNYIAGMRRHAGQSYLQTVVPTTKQMAIPTVQPIARDKTYVAQLPEVVITGHKPTLSLPNLNDLLRTGLDKLLLGSLGIGPEGFDYNKYAFLFTPPAFKDGKDPENTLNGVTTINRTLPEITVTPSDDSGAYLFLANYMIPDKQLRDAFYEYGENSKDPYEYIKRSWDLWNAAGKPYVVPYSSDDAVGRSHYSYIPKQGFGKIFNPIGKIFSPFYHALGLKNTPNTMYIENDTGKHFFSELAHAFQQNADVAVGESTRMTRPEWDDKMHYRYPRTTESNAHYIIEPQLLNYVLKLPNNISIADIIANSNNIATSSLEPIKYKTAGAYVNKTPNVTEEAVNELIKPVRRNHKYDML